MIIELPDTTTGAVARALVQVRDEGGAVALGRVLTLVVDAADGDPEPAIEAANVASREHPCRIVVVCRCGSTGDQLDAQIRVGGDAGASEVIVLRAGPELLGHADTLITPLMLPDAPIVAWWPYEVPEEPSSDPIGVMAGRRISDSLACANPLDSLRGLRAAYAEGDTDLAWTRLTVWRGLLAAALDQPPYERVSRAVVAGNDVHPSVPLLAAWLAQALRCPVDLELSADAQGVTSVRLDRESGPIVLDRPDARVATLHQPGQPDRHIAMPLRTLTECLAEELRRMDPDEVYGEVLRDGLARVGVA
ncbi:glucose-6-phosphate dehydrogenase assembly protein OpcA [Isoptericola sp. b441]|uniref:Glucose-6-phosphate dehydrogenase assembly protein OpcA n=1 Tax=Actinotalea lenta TaxID=3064654 RepID=A0ABT9DBX0_9CELL|nr:MULTISPECIES: glucose-6-phosphate dehydrogenase assembly protein OpcA [unclassified Isoptericola]MDO8107678.1 glucose-6-phosphate dehydrogenase assembly protein OpcA [Isoptericola sp. b441]MDO8120662.1 glucose-6-phosphate dehydrogenase assembly protein OpcA [Isoptericola sp. b490]